MFYRMAFGTSGSGCSFLVWIDQDSWRLEGLAADQRNSRIQELLEDVVCLLTGRWSMDSTIVESKGVLYAHLVCARYPVGSATFIRALGDLGAHVKIHRGALGDSPQQMIKYIECKQKYNVPDVVSEGFSGDAGQETVSQSSWNKRTRK